LSRAESVISLLESKEANKLNFALLRVLNKLKSEFQDASKSLEAKEAPSHFICPILCEVMVDPVLTLDGQTYERVAIEEWLESHDTSPVTNLPLAQKLVFPNIALRNMIEDWRKSDHQEDKHVYYG
jgi:hypothetical protein